METGLLWFFLFLALGIGWFLGYVSKPRAKQEESHYQPPQDVKHRLQLLFDSYSDKSIDQFVQTLEVSQDTLGIHISIGKHFRTNGEVEKAILIHQNLMAHPELDKSASEPVIYELAKDYSAAGLFDRAEALLIQLRKSKSFALKSQTLLLDIYEREREWQNALDTATGLDLKKNSEVALRAAYYCCEIAEEAQRNNDFLSARRHLKKALSLAKNCVRAYLELAKMEIAQENYRSAISHLKHAAEYDPESLAITLPLLLECTVQTNSYGQYRDYLEKLFAQTGQVAILLAIADSFVSENKLQEASDFLEKELSKEPSLSMLNAYLANRSESQSISGDTLNKLERIINKVQAERSNYRCVQCGFSGSHMHWICPSCKRWQTIKPAPEYAAQDLST